MSLSQFIPGALALVLPAYGPLPTAEDLVSRLHAPRADITRYELVIDAREGRGGTRPHLRRIWRDGERYRVDHFDQFDGKGAARRRIDCTNGPKPGLFFTIQYDPVFDPGKSGTMRPLGDRHVLIDDRFRLESLGATPEEIVNQAHQRGLKWYLGRKEWTEKRVERCRWKALPAYRIVLAAPDHAVKPDFEVTVLPCYGYAAVSARMSWTEDGKVQTEGSECELTRVAGVWLPKSSVYRRRADGKLVAELVQRIEYVGLNKSVEGKAFTLEGMGLIRGTLVSTADGLMRWDGKRLVAQPGVPGP
jgi:hypothetical protein